MRSLVAIVQAIDEMDALFVPGGQSQWNGSEWRRRAACIGIDPAMFFPLSENGVGSLQTELAKVVCASCSVRPDCLAFALSTFQSDGI